MSNELNNEKQESSLTSRIVSKIVNIVKKDPAKTTPQIESSTDIANTPISANSVGVKQSEELEQFGRAEVITVNDKGDKELVDTVVAVKQYYPKKVLITLSSGQVWRQNVAKSFLLRKNDKVRIYPSRWGKSYRMSVVGKSSFIQVARAN